MEIKTLLRANLKAHRKTMAGVSVLIMLVSISLCTVLSVWLNSDKYVNRELERLGYGDITAWVSGLQDITLLAEEISSLDEVKSAGIQTLVFSEYETGAHKSDSEGQLIVYDPKNFQYKFFADNLSEYSTAPEQIAPREIYVPASMISLFGVQKGDEITFPIARSGGDISFTVAGFYEDPFMGSSMIGMKGFLINAQGYETILSMIKNAGSKGLARDGFMLHITQSGDLSASEFNILINERTSLQRYTEFTHSREAISGFMLTLQNVFTSLLLAFVAVLLLASVAVLSHSIGSTIEQDYSNLGILKSMGFTGRKLRFIQLSQYVFTAVCAMAAGILLSVPAVKFVCQMTVTTTGLLIPHSLPAGICFASLLVIVLFLMCFVWLCTGRIEKISPVETVRGTWKKNSAGNKTMFPIKKKGLLFWSALRQISTGRHRYIGVCVVSILLVFFASLIGRVENWLGPNGEGLMDAFNPADLHIAAQPMGVTNIEEIEQLIENHTSITDVYGLAMPGVSVNGLDMTANVITEPERFHILSGRTCFTPEEIVLTEFVAADLGVSVGDTVTVAGSLGSGEYIVSGIYQCANDMGMNVGMRREGYARIGRDTPNMWCSHYFISDTSMKSEIMQALTDAFGADVYLHENSWPGLYGILSAMKLLMIFLYIMVILFVLVAALLTAEKLLRSEQRDLTVHRVVGFSLAALRFSFTLRFVLIAMAGSILGTLLSAFLTDPLVAVLMRMEGISNFSSQPDFLTVLFPGAVVTVLSAIFSFLAGRTLGKPSPEMLSEE